MSRMKEEHHLVFFLLLNHIFIHPLETWKLDISSNDPILHLQALNSLN